MGWYFFSASPFLLTPELNQGQTLSEALQLR